jgi:hypothetical protein
MTRAQRLALAQKNQDQSEALAYVKNNISTKRTNDLKTASAQAKAKIAKLKSDSEAAQKKALAAVQTQLTALIGTEAIPPNATPAAKLLIQKQNRVKLLKAVNDGKINVNKLKSDLSKAATAASKAYSAQVTAINKKYNTALTTETTNIKSKVN